MRLSQWERRTNILAGRMFTLLSGGLGIALGLHLLIWLIDGHPLDTLSLILATSAIPVCAVISRVCYRRGGRPTLSPAGVELEIHPDRLVYRIFGEEASLDVAAPWSDFQGVGPVSARRGAAEGLVFRLPLRIRMEGQTQTIDLLGIPLQSLDPDWRSGSLGDQLHRVAPHLVGKAEERVPAPAAFGQLTPDAAPSVPEVALQTVAVLRALDHIERHRAGENSGAAAPADSRAPRTLHGVRHAVAVILAIGSIVFGSVLSLIVLPGGLGACLIGAGIAGVAGDGYCRGSNAVFAAGIGSLVLGAGIVGFVALAARQLPRTIRLGCAMLFVAYLAVSTPTVWGLPSPFAVGICVAVAGPIAVGAPRRWRGSRVALVAAIVAAAGLALFITGYVNADCVLA